MIRNQQEKNGCMNYEKENKYANLVEQPDPRPERNENKIKPRKNTEINEGLNSCIENRNEKS